MPKQRLIKKNKVKKLILDFLQEWERVGCAAIYWWMRILSVFFGNNLWRADFCFETP